MSSYCRRRGRRLDPEPSPPERLRLPSLFGPLLVARGGVLSSWRGARLGDVELGPTCDPDPGFRFGYRVGRSGARVGAGGGDGGGRRYDRGRVRGRGLGRTEHIGRRGALAYIPGAVGTARCRSPSPAVSVGDRHPATAGGLAGLHTGR